MAAEDDSFVIGDTPMNVDFEQGQGQVAWPPPWTGRAFVATHGAYGTNAGARLVAIAMDPQTGMPMRASNVGGTATGGMTDFATGWAGTTAHGRPAAVAFASDGRLFLANDNNGDIVWIAPIR